MNKKVIGSVIAIIAVAALVFAVVAMQKDDNNTSDNNTNSGNSSSDHNMKNMDSGNESSSDGESTATDTVAIEDFAYTPQTITVKKGTKVTWTNKDSVAHTVTVDSGTGPDSELFGQGESYSYTFNEIGTFGYFCKPHPNMTGKVIVTE